MKSRFLGRAGRHPGRASRSRLYRVSPIRLILLPVKKKIAATAATICSVSRVCDHRKATSCMPVRCGHRSSRPWRCCPAGDRHPLDQIRHQRLCDALYWLFDHAVAAGRKPVIAISSITSDVVLPPPARRPAVIRNTGLSGNRTRFDQRQRRGDDRTLRAEVSRYIYYNPYIAQVAERLCDRGTSSQSPASVVSTAVWRDAKHDPPPLALSSHRQQVLSDTVGSVMMGCRHWCIVVTFVEVFY